MTEGYSTAQLEIAVPPAFDSAETGAEMVELYWRALTRDVPFREYPDDEDVRRAVVELRDTEGYHGPGSDADPQSDRLTARNVFRGVVPGAQTGPYVSQFLLKDRVLGRGVVDQRIEPAVAGATPRDYLTDVSDWLKVQRGVVPGTDRTLPGNETSDERRYILTGRDMAERVHDNPPYRQIQKAAQVLVFSMRAPLDEGIPYTMKPFDKTGARLDAGLASDDAVNGRETESRREVDSFLSQTTLPFNDFGPLYIEKKAVEATEHGQKAAWHKKWNVHRRLRPEEYGGRVEAAIGNKLDEAGDYPIPDNLRHSEALEQTARRYDSLLLPQAYAEGSPTHPSYPAGHSVVAGAGVTVLKAFFDERYVLAADEKVVPNEDGSELLTAETLSDGSAGFDVEPGIFDELTVGGELNKLAANMALGRNRAGIHYRTDGIEGLRLGERAAIAFLEDQLTLPQGVEGVALSLETFDGESVTVEPTA
ncbi:MAG: vanadium-dependent haloperoxidase [Haloferacaceae archaeon]